MTTIRSTILLGAALVIGGISSARAADIYDNGGSMKDDFVAESHATWYVRADTAYGHFDDPVMVEKGIFDLTSTSIDRTWSVGGGIGRYFSHNLRGDLTYDYRFEADVSGTQSDVNIGTFPGERKFGLKSHVFLANMYFDFNREGRFNPYLGAGLGFVRHETTGNKAAISGTVAGCGCTTTTYNASFGGADETQVAGALMAGFSLKLREKLHLDAGYRYMYLGEAHTGNLSGTITDTVAATTTAANGGDPTVESIHAHEIRIGLRYDIR